MITLLWLIYICAALSMVISFSRFIWELVTGIYSVLIEKKKP
jgi:hypothetical protein